MILAGDIGGTKTLLGLFDPRRRRGRAPIVVREFATLDYRRSARDDRAFAADERVRGVAIDRRLLRRRRAGARRRRRS